MATVTVYPTSYSVIKGTWDNPTYMYADDGSYVTVTPTTLASRSNIHYFFPSCDIPSGSTVNSVTLRTQWKASSSTAQLSSVIQIGYDGSTLGDPNTDTASDTSDRTQSNTTTGTWTVEMLNSGLAYGAMNAYRGKATGDGTCSFDYLCIIVDYTEGSSGTEYTKDLTATIIASAAFNRITDKFLSTSIIAAAFIAKAAKKVLAGTGSVTALVIKRAYKALSSVTMASASISYRSILIFLKTLTAMVSASASVNRKAGKISSASASAIATESKSAKKISSSASSVTGNSVKKTSRIMSAAANIAGTANNMRKYVLTAFSGVTSGMIKKVGKISVSYFSVTASIQRVIKKAVNAAVNTTGTAVKKAVKTVRGTAGTSASFVKKAQRTLSVSVSAASGEIITRVLKIPAATVTVYPTSYSVIGGTWKNPTNMYADDGSYVTVSPPARFTTYNIHYFFPSANIPAGATINSVTLRTQWKASSSTAQLSSKIQIGYDGSTLGELNTDLASDTSDRTQSNTTTGTWTVEMLNSGLAYGAMNAYGANLYADGTCSFDYLCIIVDYTEGDEPEYTKELTANTSITANAAKKAKKVLFKTVSAGALFIASFLSGGEEYFKELIASVAASALFARGTVKIIRTAAIKITAYVRFPFKIIRYVLLSWIIREKQLNTAERAKELEIKERKIDTEVME